VDPHLQDDGVRYTILGLGIVHAVICLLWGTAYMVNWTPIVVFKRQHEREEDIKETNAINIKLGKKVKNLFSIQIFSKQKSTIQYCKRKISSDFEDFSLN
jgi:hypothetical protein